MLELGATYIDAYVRRILADALAYGLEDGFINGDGKNKPVGILKNINGSVTQVHILTRRRLKLQNSILSHICL